MCVRQLCTLFLYSSLCLSVVWLAVWTLWYSPTLRQLATNQLQTQTAALFT